MSEQGLWARIRSLVSPKAAVAVPPNPKELDPLYSGGQTIWIGTERDWVDSDGNDGGTFVRGGRVIDEETAFQVSVVWACVDIQARHIAASDWNIYERTGRNRSREMYDDPLNRLLNRRPNSDMSAIAFKRALAIAQLSWGQGYCEILRDMSSRVAGFYPIHPERVTPFRDQNGLAYAINNGAHEPGVIRAENMIHVKGPSIIGLMGVNKIGLAAGTIALTIATNEFSSSYFRNGGRPGGTLEVTGKLQDEDFERLKKQWANRHEGPDKAFKTAILDNGAKYTAIPNDAQKGQTIESRQFQIEEVCRFWGVPPHKIGHLIRASENNIEHQGKAFVNDCLRPIAIEFQQEFDEKCLNRRSGYFYSKIDLDWVMAGTFKDRMEGYREARNIGVLNANEIREVEGWDSIGPDGDKFIVQGAMIELKDVGMPYKNKQKVDKGADAMPEPAEEEEDDVEAPTKAWLRNIYSRVDDFVFARSSDLQRNGDSYESAQRKAIAHGAEYLQRQLADVWPFLKDRAELAREFGEMVMRGGLPIDDAIRAVWSSREKSSGTPKEQGGEAG